jgi:hypothetical protein
LPTSADWDNLTYAVIRDTKYQTKIGGSYISVGDGKANFVTLDEKGMVICNIQVKDYFCREAFRSAREFSGSV